MQYINVHLPLGLRSLPCICCLFKFSVCLINNYSLLFVVTKKPGTIVISHQNKVKEQGCGVSLCNLGYDDLHGRIKMERSGVLLPGGLFSQFIA